MAPNTRVACAIDDTGGRTAQALPKETYCTGQVRRQKNYNYNSEIVHYIPPLH